MTDTIQIDAFEHVRASSSTILLRVLYRASAELGGLGLLLVIGEGEATVKLTPLPAPPGPMGPQRVAFAVPLDLFDPQGRFALEFEDGLVMDLSQPSAAAPRTPLPAETEIPAAEDLAVELENGDSSEQRTDEFERLTTESAELPDQPAELPDQPAELPDQPAELPDQPAELPDQPAELPDQPAELPDQPAELPDQSAELAELSAELAAQRQAREFAERQLQTETEARTLAEGELDSLRSQLEQARAQADETTREMRNRCAELERRLADALAELEAVNKAEQRAVREARQLKERIAQQTARIDELQGAGGA